MMHYHGTPISPRSHLMTMAGKCFCVPFPEPRDASTCLQIGQSVMFDNGAFSVFTRGGTLDIGKYYAWLDPMLGHPHWAIVPDVIDGSVVEQGERIATWPFPRNLGAPVWHMGLPIDWLLCLADSWPRLCFGSTAQYWQVGSPAWARRADEAFNELSKRHKRLPWIHMLRGLSLCGDRWPFASADSTNVARNHKNIGEAVCPERMARNIDAVQCTTSWSPQMIQQQIFECQR